MNEKKTSALRMVCPLLMVGLCLSVGLLPACTANGDDRATEPGVELTVSWSFEKVGPGAPPEAWTIAETNPAGTPAEWQVLADRSAPSGDQVLACATTANRGHTYNVALSEDVSSGDLDLTVAVKAMSGVEDQGGGPLWRCVDENNYYICRFNPLESNYRVYFVKDGKRTQLASADVGTEPGTWYRVRVVMRDDSIACYLDGEKLLEVRDETFPDPGKVGLWTKADAVTWFDDLIVKIE